MSKISTVLCSILLTAMAVPAWAQSGEAPAPAKKVAKTASVKASATTVRMLGNFPSTPPKVTLDLTDDEISEALGLIAEQAGWDLVVTIPERVAERSITLQLKDKPATTALELVLEAADLQATFKDAIVIVKYVGPPVADDDDISLRVRGGGKRRFHAHGERANERVSFGSDVNVAPGEVVDEAVSIGGSVTVMGTVRNDAVSIGGSVAVGPGGVVEGNAVSIGGSVDVAPGGIVKGDQVGIDGPLGGLLARLVDVGTAPTAVTRVIFGALAALLRGLMLLVIGVLLVSFVPERIATVGAALTQRTAQATLAGLAIMVGFFPLCLLLLITVIGIPLVPVAFLLLIAMLAMGMTALCVWLGERIPLFAGKKTPITAMLLGLAIVVLVDLIPLVGTPLIFAASFITAGAVLLSRFGRKPPQPQATLVPAQS